MLSTGLPLRQRLGIPLNVLVFLLLRVMGRGSWDRFALLTAGVAPRLGP